MKPEDLSIRRGPPPAHLLEAAEDIREIHARLEKTYDASWTELAIMTAKAISGSELATITAERDALREDLKAAIILGGDLLRDRGALRVELSELRETGEDVKRKAVFSSKWSTKMHDEMVHQSARANEWREEAIRLAAALRIWSGKYHPGVPELVEFEKMKERKP